MPTKTLLEQAMEAVLTAIKRHAELISDAPNYSQGWGHEVQLLAGAYGTLADIRQAYVPR